MSKSIEILSRADIRGILKESMSKELDFIYHELNKIRNRLTDLEEIMRIKKEKN